MKGVNPQKSGQHRTLPVDPQVSTKALDTSRQVISGRSIANRSPVVVFSVSGKKGDQKREE